MKTYQGRRIQILLLLQCLVGCLVTTTAHSADLEILFTDVESAKGTLQVALYNKAEDFLSDRTLRANSAIAAVGSVTVVFYDLEPGEYAVLSYHDENGNSELDSNFVGIPKEALGVSNDAPARFGPPKYEDAKFIFGDATMTIQIKMRN